MPDSEPPLIDWVMEIYQAIGEYVGASYEAYEADVLALLKAIDSHIPRQDSEEGGFKEDGKIWGTWQHRT